MDRKLLKVSASPHMKTGDTVTGIMRDVIIALIPSLAASVVWFGFRTLLVTAVCVGCTVLFEYLTTRILKKPATIGDLSAVVTGLLLAFNLPAGIPLWMCAVGAFFAIVVAKQLFGGIGKNFVNPAIVGRIIMLVSFSGAMTTWPAPLAWRGGVDAVTTATPLTSLKAREITEAVPSLLDMFLGKRGGSLGETCALALLIGFAYLLIRRVIKPVIPLCFVGTVAVIMFCAGRFDARFMLYEILSGGLLLGAIFMATDYSTCPISVKGKIVFAVGCGVITAVIRLFGNLPEGVSYSILLMNILVPHIETLTRPNPFGKAKKKKEKKSKEAA